MSEVENPAAFPVSWHDGSAPDQGMTLRDYFAGQALIGILSDPVRANNKPSVTRSWEVAEHAYAFASAMLVERAKVVA